MNYKLKIDVNAWLKTGKNTKNYYIFGSHPSCFITDNMTYNEARKVVKSLQQLGHSVEDLTK